ncbi:MAG: NifU family protein [Alphaproteobacteria bacterium]|nr:NifU family protein [Alphaproteobacteria bacterium]MAS47480.1 NifU family protein [Alphaproteobacteria bacterium]MAX96648.1 NifU family protein [Alphaproteobacteria bacterium]MBN52213.1 NifU family protein [Alphaproteobacteria bacterium]OUT41025.1 MAG: NifU family protein [Micavibrio sp. TMED2]|tara:strand:- start:981 stop:1544 length:564 start_codon:yes stop_codon:yes gene_type:complete
MFIETEETPNPATIKFLPGRDVMGRNGTADFRDAEAASNSPLASRLLDVNGIDGVFLGHDFVSVSKADDADWFQLKPLVLGAIMEHFSSGQPVMLEEQAAGDTKPEAAHDDDEVSGQIRELIETRVRPAVAQDGGDIVFERFEDGVVYLHMRGACAGCPSSTMTLKHGIENMLRHYIPEVEEVQPIM